VTQEELARAVNQEATKYPGQERQVVEYFQNNPGAVQALRAPIYEEKVVDYVIELADVKEVTVDRDTLFAEDDEAPAKKPAKKAPAKKAAAKKTAGKEAAAKSDDKPTAKKPAAKKSEDSKPAAKKAPAKKAAAKKG